MERILHTLPNGLRVIAERSDGHVAYIGLLTNAGSRDDGYGKDGLAHFVEHTIFKGTASRNSWQISNRMESIGGELNAYTTKEEIMLYTSSPSGYEDRAVELLADLVMNARFPDVEIERERGVILEEIHSYRDNASYAVFDEFDELLFADSELAHNILGYTDTVDKIEARTAREFLSGKFSPANMVMYCVAPSDPQRNLKFIEKYFGSLERHSAVLNRPEPRINPVFDETRNRDNHQANVLMGKRIFGMSDQRRYALFLISNLLGGPGMNSRFTRELRDRRGLVYTVESNVAFYTNAGAYQVYFACEPRNVKKCSTLIRHELERLADEGLSERMLAQAKRQLCGQLLISGDNRENCSMGYAKSLLRHGKILDNSYTAERIRQLTTGEVSEVARIIAEGEMSRLVII